MKREVKIGDVFAFGSTKMIIQKLPSEESDPVFRYAHVSKENLSSVERFGYIRVPAFNEMLKAGSLKFEYNMFDLCVVDLFLI